MLDGFLEIRQSAAVLALGVLVPGDEGFCFTFGIGLVADPGFPKNLFLHKSH